MKSLALPAAALVIMASALNMSAALAQSTSYTDLSKAPAGEYLMDKTHGYTTFSYSHQGYSRPWLRFRNINAALTVDGEDLGKSIVTVDIDPASIDSGVDIFDEHLVGSDFFNVAQFPDIKFVSSSAVVDGENISLSGDLSMKGITKPLTLTGKFNQGGIHLQYGKPVLGFSATGTLKRSDWGLGYGVPFVGDEVSLVIEAEFIKK